LKKLTLAGLIEMTIPDKPNSRLQKYRLTAKGRKRLADQAVLPADDRRQPGQG